MMTTRESALRELAWHEGYAAGVRHSAKSAERLQLASRRVERRVAVITAELQPQEAPA